MCIRNPLHPSFHHLLQANIYNSNKPFIMNTTAIYNSNKQSMIMTAISSELRKPEIRATILLAVVAFHGPLLLVLSSRQRRSGNPVGRFYLMVFFVPSQQLCMVSVSKKMFQMWYYSSIPHNLGRDFRLGTFALNITITLSFLSKRFESSYSTY